ncbi:unnamed protein product [Nyctereutes procyonoides]|uniref:(raccoon dog) hypothetical protein n=1 Tax=Nyctereutes procyonoides TaxID=34880 RepID=A0A811Z5X0_NYCPR|nr:unnamed protein product [Nyctereutes procyonoides]
MMVYKVKKEAAAALPKAETKAKALKAKKTMLKGIHSHKEKRSTCHPYSNNPRHCVSKSSPNILKRTPPEETSLTTMPSSSSWTTSSAMEKIEDDNTLVFIMDVKAKKHQIKQAVKKL